MNRRSPNETSSLGVSDTSAGLYPREGIKIGGYTLIDTLGQGAMATVFLATDDTGHEVAFKVFQEGPGVSKTMLERFRREAEASKKLRRHPHILTIYATGKEPPFHYIVMETVKTSKTLENAMESTPMSMYDIVQLIIKLARALQYAHTRSIIHRDVKPSNVMIDEFGEPLLTDFGVAELVDWPSCTMTGALTGTPLYMSPEQARAEKVGPASDIYSLGVVLYEALTGVLPYSVQHCSPIKEVLEAVKNEQPRRPRLFRKEISPDLEAVLLKALDKDEGSRYRDAESFAVDLERAITGRRVSARHFSPFDHIRHLVRRHQRSIAIGLALVMVGSVVGIYYRRQLQLVHYDTLIWLAQLKNAEYVLAQSEEVGSTSQTPAAWQQIRLARKAMLANDWEIASKGFLTAVTLSTAVGDARTAAIAQLEQARCETMMNKREEAEQIYRRILRNQDTSPAIASLAQIESLGLVLLSGDRAGALNILLLHEQPLRGPLRAAMDCLGGEISPERVLEMIENTPPRFRNDLYMAIALRYHTDGELKKFLTFLKECVRTSTPSSEWPGPFAKHLYREILERE